MHKTLSDLRKDNNIKVCPLDKGNGVCVMNTVNYFEKLDSIILNEDKFIKIDYDLTSTDHEVCKKAPWIKKRG